MRKNKKQPTKETRAIEVQAYRDPEGRPTCAACFRTRQVCVFYRTRKMGLVEECALDEHRRLERRGKDGLGFLKPGKRCLVWGEAGA
jgi:hypothetical protein